MDGATSLPIQDLAIGSSAISYSGGALPNGQIEEREKKVEAIQREIDRLDPKHDIGQERRDFIASILVSLLEEVKCHKKWRLFRLEIRLR